MNRPKGGMWRMACLAGLAAVVIFFLTVGREPLREHFQKSITSHDGQGAMAFTTIGPPSSLPPGAPVVGDAAVSLVI